METYDCYGWECFFWCVWVKNISKFFGMAPLNFTYTGKINLERYLDGICKQMDFELYDIVDDDIFISVQDLERFADCDAINNRRRKNQIAFCNKTMESNLNKCQVRAAIFVNVIEQANYFFFWKYLTINLQST